MGRAEIDEQVARARAAAVVGESDVGRSWRAFLYREGQQAGREGAPRSTGLGILHRSEQRFELRAPEQAFAAELTAHAAAVMSAVSEYRTSLDGRAAVELLAALAYLPASWNGAQHVPAAAVPETARLQWAQAQDAVRELLGSPRVGSVLRHAEVRRFLSGLRSKGAVPPSVEVAVERVTRTSSRARPRPGRAWLEFRTS